MPPKRKHTSVAEGPPPAPADVATAGTSFVNTGAALPPTSLDAASASDVVVEESPSKKAKLELPAPPAAPADVATAGTSFVNTGAALPPTSLDAASASDVVVEESPSKKAKLELPAPPAAPSTGEAEGGDTDVDEERNATATGEEGGDTDVDDDDDEDEDDDDRPPCWYGANCYRKNPQHFKEFKHPHIDDKPKKEKKPKATGSASKKKANTASAPPAPSPSPAVAAPALSALASTPAPVPSAPTPATPGTTSTSTATTKSGDSSGKEAYRCVVQVILAKNKITPDEKRILRGFRRTHNVPDKDHFAILQEFGWTEDEYDDGERKDDDIEVDEERALLESASGFGYIKLSKSRKMTTQQEAVFSKVAAQFYQTMAKAQGNYSIKEVWIVVNRDLKEKYSLKKRELTATGGDVNEVLAFHGTSRPSIEGITKTGFLPPTKLPSEKGSSSNKAQAYKIVKNKKKKVTTTSKSKKKKIVVSEEEEELDITVLDDGFFGKGIYFSIFSDYAMWYSEERQSDQILLCKVIKGKSFRCDGRMDGAGRKPGYDSHCSPKGNEIIIFEPDQIMPRYVISFESKEAEEREQEG